MANAFVKWAGGKKQLLTRLVDRMPKEFLTYYEPFIGGGTMLLNLMPQKAVMSDINPQLINAYKQIKTNSNQMIEFINELDNAECDKDRYYSIRERYNKKIKNEELDVECAALMIWLNKHCFNGLYRVNGKGLFNVPFNNKKNGKSVDEDNIIAIGNYLREFDVDIRLCDFEETCKTVKAGDFVYFDSPYIPVSETASFTDYAKEGFSYEDHIRLSELFRVLDERGAKLMLSNHDVPLVHELYKGYNIERVEVRRAINRDASKRTGEEVIVRNYCE